TGYFAKHDLNKWVTKYSTLVNIIRGYEVKELFLSDVEVDIINRYLAIIDTNSELRKQYNDKFIEYELSQTNAFFNDVEGRSLDKQQRTAIITNDDNSLIIAGAG